ncbi:MAG: hypothetical protein NVS9B5_03820 [Terriglobales bacterium]
MAGLPVPNGSTAAQYQLTVEALDPFWSHAVGPYGPSQVQPSIAPLPVLVTATIGGDVQQDIVDARQRHSTTSILSADELCVAGIRSCGRRLECHAESLWRRRFFLV